MPYIVRSFFYRIKYFIEKQLEDRATSLKSSRECCLFHLISRYELAG